MDDQENSVADKIVGDKIKCETIRQLAKRHMMDQYHSTTDEELKNAIVEVDIEPFPEFRPAEHKAKRSEE